MTANHRINKGQKRASSKQVTSTKESQRIENIEWIRNRNPQHLTLQLSAMSSKKAVTEFIEQQSQTGSFAYYRKKQNGQNLYIAIYGSFANRADAEKVAARFSPLKPWIRKFGSIQETMSK
jgi:septal ring-binding cell division protein DamX